MTKEEAFKLDEILRNTQIYDTRVSINSDNWDYCVKLFDFGYSTKPQRTQDGFQFEINEFGRRFIAAGGFTKQVEDELFEKRIKKRSVWAAVIANIIALFALFVAFAAYFKEDKNSNMAPQHQLPTNLQKDSLARPVESEIKTAKPSELDLRRLIKTRVIDCQTWPAPKEQKRFDSRGFPSLNRLKIL